MEGFGKTFMKHLWRMQQIGALVTVVLVCLNLTIPLWDFTKWRFYNIGISAKYNWLIILIIFTIVFSIALVAGYIYDRIFKLWSARETVGVERNPFAKGKINPKEMLQWQYIQ